MCSGVIGAVLATPEAVPALVGFGVGDGGATGDFGPERKYYAGPNHFNAANHVSHITMWMSYCGLFNGCVSIFLSQPEESINAASQLPAAQQEATGKPETAGLLGWNFITWHTHAIKYMYSMYKFAKDSWQSFEMLLKCA